MTGPDQFAGQVVDRVRAAWLQALHPDSAATTEVAPDLGFLAGGGHSLAAARLIARLHLDLGVELPLSVILRDDPSLRELVTLVERLGPAVDSGPEHHHRPDW